MLKQAPNKSKNNIQNTRNYYLTLKSFKMTFSEGEILHFHFRSDLPTLLAENELCKSMAENIPAHSRAHMAAGVFRKKYT